MHWYSIYRTRYVFFVFLLFFFSPNEYCIAENTSEIPSSVTLSLRQVEQ